MRGRTGFTRGFTCPVLLRILLGSLKISVTGVSPSLPELSNSFSYPLRYHVEVLQPRQDKSRRFGLFPFRSPLLRESHSLSFPPGTEMFHFPGCGFTALCIQTVMSRHYSGWVFPFGHSRIKACLPLPETYRSLPRPSSPADAKAFTVCSYMLDHKMVSHAAYN